jgi:hypothetical protein
VQWKPFRITELWAKTTYVLVGWFLLPAALGWLMDLAGVPIPAIIAFDAVLSALVIWIGTRAFRGRGEAIEPPRVWWRATGRPRAGFVLGGLFLWGTVSTLTFPLRGPDPSLNWFAITLAPIAAFYLHSSIRLVRGDAPVPPKPRRDDDLKLIDRKRRF